VSFDWSEYLLLAEELCDERPDRGTAGTEARRRTAVSRAYYAAFLSARNRLRDADGVVDQGILRSHRRMAAEFEHDGDVQRRLIGIALSRLRANRVACDYDDAIDGLEALAAAGIFRAKAILTGLGRL
jgi:uncharacterized protein (UPF0332 family)